MGVKVEGVSWDKFLGKLRVHGTICQAPKSYPQVHTHAEHITATASDNCERRLAKHAVERLKRASENEKPILIISIDDEGFAIAETKQYGVEIRIEERTKLPGNLEADKRTAATKNTSAAP